jgi:hypothetical protein
MSAATAMFATAARCATDPRVTGYPPRVVQDGQHTIMKLCACCGQQMPHKVGAPRCVLCMLEERDEPLPRRQDDHQR